MSTRPASANATTSGGDMRKFALMFWCTRASKLRLPERTEAATRSFLAIASSIGADERAGIADAGRAAVADGLEAELVEIGLQPVLRQVVGHDARAGRERGLDRRSDLQAALDRLLRQQPRRQHDRRVGRVGAARDGRDQDAAVADRGRAVAVHGHARRRPSTKLLGLLAEAIFRDRPWRTSRQIPASASAARSGPAAASGPATLGTTVARSSSMSCE